MLESGVIGIARVVMHTKEYLAALIPSGPALMLNTLRWANEIRPWTNIKLPAEGKSATHLKDSELKMAKQLIGDMTHKWRPDAYADKFTESVYALVAKRVAAGDTETVEPMEESGQTSATSSNVIDLTELLTKSLGKRGSAAGADKKVEAHAASRKAPIKAAAANKAVAKSPRRAAAKVAAR
jgi:DNA end-binding protein Ku